MNPFKFFHHSSRTPAVDTEIDRVVRQLRGVNRMLLANLSLPYIAQEIVNQVPGQRYVRGAAIRTADSKTGALTAIAVSDALQSSASHPGLYTLKDRRVEPEALQAAQSLLAQALEQRRAVAGAELREFECPPLTAQEADQVQRQSGIASIVAYPIVTGERLTGALTFYLGRPYSALTKTDLEMMQAVADTVAIAVENSRLLAEVDTVNQKLSETNVELRTANETKEEFVSIASHQLRSPLTAIKGYLSMLADGDFGEVAPKQRPVLGQIIQSTNEVINILNDMLSVSRMNANRFELTPGAVRLEELVTDVAEEFQPLAQKKGMRLHVELPKTSLGVLNLDGSRMRQVIVNYVDNAIKYSQRGTVSIKLYTEGNDVVLTVTDTGIGIPADDLKRMFTKFYRAENARQLVSSGTGLGLYVAKRIITEHHGTPIAQSVPGQGSIFGFRLPLPMIQVAQAAPSAS